MSRQVERLEKCPCWWVQKPVHLAHAATGLEACLASERDPHTRLPVAAGTDARPLTEKKQSPWTGGCRFAAHDFPNSGLAVLGSAPPPDPVTPGFVLSFFFFLNNSTMEV